jgi:hemerythrin-like domain-containing protein
MDPIALLTEEHRLILKGLEALEGYANRLSGADPAEPGDLARFVDFIRTFADGRHHGKEENILFDTMVAQGFPREGGPIAVMLMEHDQNRELTREMAAGIGREADWTQGERDAVAEAALGYVHLLRSHIWKEDNILYPMATNQLPGFAYEKIANACRAFEQERGEDEAARYAAAVEELWIRYAAASAAARPEAPRSAGAGGAR